MLHLHRFKGQQTLPLGNLFTLRNLDAVTLPGIGARISPSARLAADAAARRAIELIGLAFVEDDHPLLVAKAGYCRHRLIVVELDAAELAAAAERDAERWSAH